MRWSGVQRAKRWTSSRLDGVAEGGENVGQRALPARQQRLDHLSPEAGSAPATGGDEQARELSQMGAFEIDDGRPNLAGEAFFGLGVEGRPGDRGGRPSRQERPRPDKILVHAAIMAWTSANWVAHKPWPGRKNAAEYTCPGLLSADLRAT